MRLPFLLPLGLFLVASATACSSNGSSAGTSDSGPSPSSSGDSGPPNPYGVAYPSNMIGMNARRADIAGDQIANFSFQGYPDGDPTKGLQTISLSDFYDPQGKDGFKLLHLGVAAVWCTACDQETKAIVPDVAMDKTQGVVFAQTLGYGAEMNTAATVTDLNNWCTDHKSNFAEMLDPMDQNLGMFFSEAALPWNALIDARSMEILEAGVGFTSSTFESDITTWLSWIAQNPPSYTPQ